MLVDVPIAVGSGNVVCRVTERGGVAPDDARTAADLLCGELAERDAPAAGYDVRFGRLEGKVVVTVTNVSRQTSQRLVLGGLSEMPVASKRMAIAFKAERPVAETEGADTVMASEARSPVVKAGQTAGFFGLVGATSATSMGAAGGFDLGLDYRLSHVALGAHGRAGGIGSSDRKLAFVSADIGVRAYPWEGDTAPFLGGGVVLGYFNAIGGDAAGFERRDRSGSGLGSFAELGVEMFRTARIGFRASLRADLPFYTLDGQYDVPLAMNVGLSFR